MGLHDALNTSLAIDLSALKQSWQLPVAVNQQTPTTLAEEATPTAPTKTLAYCPKCPARFPLAETCDNAELTQHMRAHSEDHEVYCLYCLYSAEDEAQLQTHRAVHSNDYQERCRQLYANYKAHSDWPAPKLMQMKSDESAAYAQIWLVENEPRGSSVMPAARSSFDGQNSLLKKLIELGNATPASLKMAPVGSTKLADTDDDETMNTESDDASSDESSTDEPPPQPPQPSPPLGAAMTMIPKPCRHCPYESCDGFALWAHTRKHICISNKTLAHTCAHCDYTDDDIAHIEEHTVLHFNPKAQHDKADLFATFENVEIYMERKIIDDDDDDGYDADTDTDDEADDAEKNNNNENRKNGQESGRPRRRKRATTKILVYKSGQAANKSVEQPPNEKDMIFVDINTGKVIE